MGKERKKKKKSFLLTLSLLQAHGAYNKAKKAYLNVTGSGGEDGSARQTDRLKNERDVLKQYVDLFEALKKAFGNLARDLPRQQSSFSAIATLLSREAAGLGENLQVLMETVANFISSMIQHSTYSNQIFEQAIPSYIEAFLNVEYADAKTQLHLFDRAAKNLSDAEARLASLRTQPRPDMVVVGQQEALVQQCVADLDRAEERAYDTLFKINEDAQLVLVRCMSQFLRAWSDHLAGAAADLQQCCDALQQEKQVNPDLQDLALPASISSSASAPSSSSSSSVVIASSPPRAGSRPLPPGPAPTAIPQRPSSRPVSQQFEVPPPVALGPVKTVGTGVPRARSISTAAPAAAPSSVTSDGEKALDQLLALQQHQQQQQQASSPSSSFLQPAQPVPLGDASSHHAPTPSVSSNRLSVLEPAGSEPNLRKGRQKVERSATTSSEVVLSNDPNEFTTSVYHQLAPVEADRISSRSFGVRIGKRSLQLSVDAASGSIVVSEPMVPTLEFTIQDVLQFYKATKHSTRLCVRFNGRQKDRFEFSTFEERERCWEMFWAMRGIPLQPTVTVFCTTFNFGEARGPDEAMGQWLPEGYDIYAVGVQECEYIPHRQYNSVEADLFAAIQKHLGPDYVKVAGQSLLSIRLIVFVRRRYASHCTNVKMRKVPCGHLGKVGNKGAVAITMHLLNSRICFVTAHLAAHDERYLERNQDLQNIFSGLSSLVPGGISPLNYYHALFVFGDFNYRVELPRDTVLTYLENGDAGMLLKKDQLLRAMSEGAAFFGFQEGQVSFLPTYRMLRGRDGYSDEKLRIPSWTDRVLWRALPAADVRLGAYSACTGVLTSDHRPVFGAFQVPLFKPNLPHSPQIRCNIAVTKLHGELVVPRLTSVAFYSPNLLDPNNPPETVTSHNAQWGDTAPFLYPVSANPSYVSARHLMIAIRVERREVVATSVLPLAPACGAAQSFKVFLTDDKGLYAGTVSGVLQVNFSTSPASR